MQSTELQLTESKAFSKTTSKIKHSLFYLFSKPTFSFATTPIQQKFSFNECRFIFNTIWSITAPSILANTLAGNLYTDISSEIR